MNCEQARIQFAAALTEGAASPVLEEPLTACAQCREEGHAAHALGGARAVGRRRAESRLRRGFYQAVEAYRDGLAQNPVALNWDRSSQRWWHALWPQRPALQLALSLALLAVGAGVGYLTSRPGAGDANEVAQLRGEIGGLRQIITLSLLQQQSAVDRLPGVTWSYRVEQSDVEVLGALLRTINEDQNADVRLAAVDAMRSFTKVL